MMADMGSQEGLPDPDPVALPYSVVAGPYQLLCGVNLCAFHLSWSAWLTLVSAVHRRDICVWSGVTRKPSSQSISVELSN